MVPPIHPDNESERLSALNEYGILDSLPEVEYEDITRIAAQICGTSMSFVTIIDHNRQWFKAHFGTELTETPREYSFCGHTITNGGQPFVVEDSHADPRFSDNPIVTGPPHIQFYAGIPLINPEGYALGALCVLDNRPHRLSGTQLETIEALGRQVMRLFELRRVNKRLTEKQKELTAAYEDLDKFATIASHDLRSPLNNIVSLSTILNELYEGVFDADGAEYLNYLKESAIQLTYMVDGILEY
ncbi:MAG: GAF domain-containing protein, partial [Chitinophagia bacterium]|nr:GAF domain-containing protein [Chitinophagia bacterium]